MGKIINMPIGVERGMWSSGDPSLIPDGYCRTVRNMVIRPNRLETRAPLVYDSLMAIRGLAVFDDQTNKVSRLMAVDSSQAIYEKATSGDAWSASKGTLSGTRLTDSTNYRGKEYGMMDNGSGLPTAAFSFDGTTLSTSPFISAIQSRCVTAYLDRLFFAYPRVTITALNDGGTANYYLAIPLLGATVRAIISGSTTLYRAMSAAGVTSTLSWPAGTLPASTSDLVVRARLDLRAVDPTNQTPIAASLQLADAIAILTAYTVGQIKTTGGYLYMCTTAGTSAGAPPAYGTAVNSQTVDGTVTWTCLSSASLGTRNITIESASTNPEWQTIWLTFTLPPHTNATITCAAYMQWSSLAGLYPLDIGYKDALTDGDPRKANHGFQVTTGDFYYPFINKETTGTSTVDLNTIVWSEALQPTRIRASATYEVQDVPGYPTAAIVAGGRYVMFKRTAFWVFAGNQDITSLDVIPIRMERKYGSVGCIGSRALDSIDDDVYFIGEDEVYRFAVGMDNPEKICGDGMFEEIMSRGANWVESQATYNMPLLRIDKRNREVFVYTQKGVLYVYNIANKGWTKHDVAGGAEIADMMFNPNTRKMYVAVGGFGLARVDWAVAPTNDTVDNTASTYAVTKDIETRPVEMFAPRVDACVESVGVFHLASAAQTSQTLTAYASFDRGSTYPYSDAITVDITDPRNPIWLYETAPSVMVKLSHVGKAGPTIWAVSKLDVEAQIMAGEWPQVVPAGTATL